MIEFILHNIHNLGHWTYLALFIAMILEGDLVLLMTGFLIRLHSLHPIYTFLILISGALFGDYIWYLVGFHSKKFRWKWLEKLYISIRFLEKHLVSRLTRTLCIAKFVYGLHRPTCFRCGSLHLPQKLFLQANTIATIIWIIVVTSIGYLAGASFLLVRHYLKYAEIAIFIVIILILLIMHFLSKKLKKDTLLD